MTPDDAPEDLEREAPTGGEERAAAADGDAAGASGGRRRARRTAAIGLGSAVGVAGIAVLSVFIYSIIDDDSDSWSTYDYAIVDDDSGGWFGYAPLGRVEDHRFDRDGERGDGRDRPVEGRRHDKGAGRAKDNDRAGDSAGDHDRAGDSAGDHDRAGNSAGDNDRAGESAGHPDGTDGDKADGYGDAAAVAGPAGCVEVKNLGSQVLLLCDRAPAGGEAVEEWWQDAGEPPASFCIEGEVDGPRGFSFGECYGFSGDFPPDWPGLERASPGGWFPFAPDGSRNGGAYAEDFGFAFEDGFAGGDGGASNFLEGWPAGPEMPFGVPGANFGFDFEALIALLPYVMDVLGGEMFEEFLGSILEALLGGFEGLLDGFEGLPEGEGDFGVDARDELNPSGLLEELDVELLGLILEGLLAGLDESAGAEPDLDSGG